MYGIAIILLIVVIWMVFGPYIRRWIHTFVAHRTEDAVRRMMGMPSRKEEEHMRQSAETRQGAARRNRQSGGYNEGHNTGRSGGYGRYDGHDDGPLIPKEYAEDVEYTEIRSYSSDKVVAEDPDTGSKTVYHESQTEDAEIISITRDRD